jgi:transcriptional repressor NrdR
MRCPFCEANDTKVKDSRTSRDGFVVRRRRTCEACSSRFTTYEKIETLLPMVIKKDQRREAFTREKIIHGIKQACQKRPVSIETIEEIANKIEKDLMERGDKEIQAVALGEQVMQELRQLDQVAYVRFASVYRDFRDIEEFMTELQSLSGDESPT